MDSRTLLALVLSIAVLIVFQYFFGRDVSQPPREETSFETIPATGVGEQAPDHEYGKRIRTDGSSQTSSLNAIGSHDIPVDTKAPLRKVRDITVETDLYQLVFSERGGTVKKYLLKQYLATLTDNAPPVNLIDVSPPHLPLGLQMESQPPVDLSSQFFEPDKEGLKLTQAGEEAQLKFTCNMSNGIKITREYTFHQGSYWIDLSVYLSGAGTIPGSLCLYNKPGENTNRFTFAGPAYYGNDSLREVKLDDIGEKHTYTGPVDWIGYGDDYFITALIPIVSEGPWNILIEKKEADGLAESRLTALKPSPKGAGQGVEVLNLGIYFGPKDIDRLNALGHNLSKAINFGWFDPIAKPLLYFLKFLYRYIHNYGLAIIIVTILIKVAFWPLAQKSAKSMKTMQKLQPKMAKLKEKYGKDKEKMNKELMQLYKTYKVNPMGGCLPMLLQIPVFFALYKVLLQSIELRHAPFTLWINDLSAPDRLMIPGVNIPYLGGIPVLTLLMGLSMFLQQKLSPSSLDPMQARMMQFLPVIFTCMFVNFPSGLVLYWLINNVLSIAQQHYVNKFTD
ncbi:MAG: membrane protein insertase YidC [Deltaproteobacteria bacterium]|nr:membrane protein insertase YidC [Deltaproteobacteria bacterium]MBW1718720.1 membrane protein insertase YidC [Deltaproteobacteria bacterium]MBW1931863.1 membrane protein insertase YidC [Deltaproteobacteria bacterium]MBW1965010.1 membrane protein insertase YidC [Deltaproteobacteria bacterium]MBW2079476.1 membrane protein insertase YidC [Deltaproteobacteria bacterium]